MLAYVTPIQAAAQNEAFFTHFTEISFAVVPAVLEDGTITFRVTVTCILG